MRKWYENKMKVICPINEEGWWGDEYRDHMFFYALTFAGSQGSCLNTRLLGQVFKYLLRDLASVNAMKHTCVIAILAYFTSIQPKVD